MAKQELISSPSIFVKAGAIFVENITNDLLEFAVSIFHWGQFENHAVIPFTGDVDEGCN